MNELFTVLPPGEAFATFGRECSPVERSEIVPLDAALGRVLFEHVRAAETLPAFARSTMDGYAVRAADTHGASEQAPAYLRLVDDAPPRAGQQRGGGGGRGRTRPGAMVPPGADAVVMVEDTNQTGPSTSSGQAEIEVLASVAEGEDV